jgi:hypothetical protein
MVPSQKRLRAGAPVSGPGNWGGPSAPVSRARAPYYAAVAPLESIGADVHAPTITA